MGSSGGTATSDTNLSVHTAAAMSSAKSEMTPVTA